MKTQRNNPIQTAENDETTPDDLCIPITLDIPPLGDVTTYGAFTLESQPLLILSELSTYPQAIQKESSAPASSFGSSARASMSKEPGYIRTYFMIRI